MTTKAEIESVAIRAGCNGAYLHLHCTYPECGCKTTPGMIKAAIAALDAHRLARGLNPEKRRLKGCCMDCGRKYGDEYGFPDLVIPNDVWNRISPTGDEGGLLCPSCICRRLHDASISTIGEFRSGPLCQHLNSGSVTDAAPAALEDEIK